MNRRKECYKCVFFEENGFQDMGAHMDVCAANPDIWDGLISIESLPLESCPFWKNKKKLIDEVRKVFK